MNKKTSMPFRIQLAVDGSEYSLAAAELVRDLPLPPGSQIAILGVLTPGRPPDEPTLQAAMARAEELLEDGAVRTQRVLLHGHAAKKLIEYGSEEPPDLMVIGARGLYATLKILLGGIAHQVVENARWPVLVMRTPYRGLRRVLLATDGSQNSRQAAQYLAGLPLPAGTELQALHVQPIYPELAEPAYSAHSLARPAPFMVPTMPSPADLQYLSRQAELSEQKGRTILAATRKILQTTGRNVTTVLKQGDPASEILAHSQAQDIDLIVAGSRGLSAIEGWWWGSVSRKLVHYAAGSVLFVRGGTGEDNPE
jgi:nucleotide-binding universal stress UspA family protein